MKTTTIDSTSSALFDSYATAALTGILSNSTIMTALGLHNCVQGNEDAIQEQVVLAAFKYAQIATKYHPKILK